MRVALACGVLASIVAGMTQPARAQEPCRADARMLGVARTVAIDTSLGPKFGAQYRSSDFLADGEVVLTFDDGPSRAYTRPILDALAAHCTKATFFMVGRMAVSDPEMVKEVDRRGHTVAAHTWSHANLQALTPLKARSEIELGFAAVQMALGKPIAPFFRYPYLRDTPSMAIHLEGRNIGAFFIDIDSKDYMTPDAASVHQRVMAQLAHRRKGIVLFHDIHASTARALPGLLAELKARGYSVVHVRGKEDASTLAEFDAMARDEGERRRVAGTTQQPLARRAIVFPVRPSVWVASDGRAPVFRQPPPVVRVRPPPRQVQAPQDDGWRTSIWQW